MRLRSQDEPAEVAVEVAADVRVPGADVRPHLLEALPDLGSETRAPRPGGTRFNPRVLGGQQHATRHVESTVEMESAHDGF